MTWHEYLSRLLMLWSCQSWLATTSFRCVCLGISCLQTRLLSRSSLGCETWISSRNWKVKRCLGHIAATCLTGSIWRVASSCCEDRGMARLARLDWSCGVPTYAIGRFHEWWQRLLWVLLIQDGWTSSRHRSGLRWTSTAAWLAVPISFFECMAVTTIELSSLLTRWWWWLSID